MVFKRETKVSPTGISNRPTDQQTNRPTDQQTIKKAAFLKKTAFYTISLFYRYYW